MSTITQITETLMSVTASMRDSDSASETAAMYKETGLALFLATLQNAEASDLYLSEVKAAHFAAEGWAHKVYCPEADKMITVEGDKAEPKVATAYSEAKRAVSQGYTFSQFETWEALRKAIKPEDAHAKVKETFKETLKLLKKLEAASGDWDSQALGELNKLNATLEAGLPKEAK